jgi:hypothetical protein
MFEACPVIPDSLPYTAQLRNERKRAVIYAIVGRIVIFDLYDLGSTTTIVVLGVGLRCGGCA